MQQIRILIAATLVAAGATAHAASGQDVNLDGSARPPHTLAATANRQLRQDNVPSVKTDRGALKTQADADLAARDARARGPRLQVQRENLKGDAARRALAAQATPNSIDRSTAVGDIEHTDQVTDLRVQLKK